MPVMQAVRKMAAAPPTAAVMPQGWKQGDPIPGDAHPSAHLYSGETPRPTSGGSRPSMAGVTPDVNALPPTVEAPEASAAPPQPVGVTGVQPTTPAAKAGDRVTSSGFGADATVRGPSERVGGIIARGGPLARLAETRGRQYAHRRGLMNTSLGAEAANKALLDFAVPLAEADTRSELYNREIAAQNRRHEMTIGEQAAGRQQTAATQRQHQIDSAVANAQNSYSSEINSIRLSTSLSEKGKINAQQDARRRLDAQIRLIESSHDTDLDWSYLGVSPATSDFRPSTTSGTGGTASRRRLDSALGRTTARGGGRPSSSRGGQPSGGRGGGSPATSSGGSVGHAGPVSGPHGGTVGSVSPGPSAGGGGGGGGGGCYLTTAIVERRGEADDGPTLTKLRAFRDGFMQETPERKKMVKDYEEIAPRIVKAIPADSRDWDWIGEQIDQAVDFIDQGALQSAMDTYTRMTHILIADWLDDGGS